MNNETKVKVRLPVRADNMIGTGEVTQQVHGTNIVGNVNAIND